MIKEMPCGCKTIPIKKGDNFKEHLLNRVAVWFDDPRCMEHENGSDTVGFMFYKNEEVIIHMTQNGYLKVEKVNMTDAINSLKDYQKIGYDFSYGYLDMVEDTAGQYTMICKGS